MFASYLLLLLCMYYSCFVCCLYLFTYTVDQHNFHITKWVLLRNTYCHTKSRTDILRLSESQTFPPHETYYHICKVIDTMSAANEAGTAYLSGYMGSTMKFSVEGCWLLIYSFMCSVISVWSFVLWNILQLHASCTCTCQILYVTGM